MRSLILSFLVLAFFSCKNPSSNSTNNGQAAEAHAHEGHGHSGHDHAGHDHSGHDHNHASDNTAIEYVNLKIDQAASVAASGTIQLFDVRSYEELQVDPRIPGARNSDVNKPEFKNYLHKLPKETPYLVYCKSGVRSAKACKIMKEMGFRSVYNMEGGYDEYKRMGYLEF